MLAIMIGKADISGRFDCCRSKGRTATRRSPSWPASINGVPSDVLISGLAHRGTCDVEVANVGEAQDRILAVPARHTRAADRAGGAVWPTIGRVDHQQVAA